MANEHMPTDDEMAEAIQEVGVFLTRAEAVIAAARQAKKGPTYRDDWPTAPAGIRALSEVLMAWKQRQERNGTEQDRHELSWPNVMDGRLAEIKDASLENKYARVADMAAACLAWLACLAWIQAPDEEGTDGKGQNACSNGGG